MIIDAWAQHPTLRHSRDPIFDSLRRWTRTEAPESQIPLAHTIAAMDAGGIDKALICAWQVPGRDMISNDEVAEFVREHYQVMEDAMLNAVERCVERGEMVAPNQRAMARTLLSTALGMGVYSKSGHARESLEDIAKTVGLVYGGRAT